MLFTGSDNSPKNSDEFNKRFFYKEDDSSKNRFIKICVINNKEIIREGLYSLLNKAPFILSLDSYTRDQFLESNEKKDYHIIINEIEFDSKVSPDIIKAIRYRHRSAKIIVYTGVKNIGFRNLSLHSGADFFLFIEDRYNLLEHLVAGLIHQLKFKNNK